MHFRVTARPLHNHAECDCGWHGKNRWLRGSAVADAYLHGAQAGHTPDNAPIVTAGETSILIVKQAS